MGEDKRIYRIFGLCLAGCLGLGLPVWAQDKPPAQEQANQKQADKAEPQPDEHKRTWEMPEVVVSGKKELKEEQLVGSYEQPRWTASRRFPTTRVYVIPEGKFEFEWWMERNTPKHGNAETVYLYEYEMGLPGRFQIDLYQGYTDQGDPKEPFAFSHQSVELRWAMAKWGEIWGNPTWYVEYKTRDRATDKEEVKLLLGGELAVRWHWGANLVREWSLEKSATQEMENELTGGVSYTMKDSVFSLGLEAKMGKETDFSSGSKGWINTLKMGPSLQWHPVPAANFQLVPLVGLTKDSERSQLWLIAGWEF